MTSTKGGSTLAVATWPGALLACKFDCSSACKRRAWLRAVANSLGTKDVSDTKPRTCFLYNGRTGEGGGNGTGYGGELMEEKVALKYTQQPAILAYPEAGRVRSAHSNAISGA